MINNTGTTHHALDKITRITPITRSALMWATVDGWRADRPFMGSQELPDRPAWRMVLLASTH